MCCNGDEQRHISALKIREKMVEEIKANVQASSSDKNDMPRFCELEKNGVYPAVGSKLGYSKKDWKDNAKGVVAKSTEQAREICW
jgi:hypothetical protein